MLLPERLRAWRSRVTTIATSSRATGGSARARAESAPWPREMGRRPDVGENAAARSFARFGGK